MQSPLQNSGIRCKTGFTLIELSIVLVIIGLIAGSVLVGSNLIENARVGTQLKQIERLETEINTFKLKYDWLPGDCANITSFVGTTTSDGNTVANGDGNATINATIWCYGTTFPAGECLQQDVSGEVAQLFLHLNIAGFGRYKTKGIVAPCGTSVGINYPPIEYDNNTGIFVTCLNSLAHPNIAPAFLGTGNVMVIGASSAQSRIGYAIGLYGTFPVSSSIGLSSNVVQMMDKKMDDGLPSSGKFGIISGSATGCASNVATYPNSSTCNATAGKIINK